MSITHNMSLIFIECTNNKDISLYLFLSNLLTKLKVNSYLIRWFINDKTILKMKIKFPLSSRQ